MRKISSDRDILVKYFPTFVLVIMTIMIVASINSEFYLATIICTVLMLVMLTSRKFYRPFKLKDVWMNEEEEYFLISTFKFRVKLLFSDLSSVKQINESLEVELLFKKRRVYFLMKDDGSIPFANKRLIEQLNEIVSENRKRYYID